MCTFNTSPMDEPLAELRWHYGEAYIINCTGPGRWTAERRDDRTVLHARSAAELLEKTAMTTGIGRSAGYVSGAYKNIR